MFTRQHYQAIAAMLRPHANEYVIRAIAGQLTDYFAADNPRFDRSRFLKACGLED